MKHYTRIPWTGSDDKTRKFTVRQVDARINTDWEIEITELDNTDGKRGSELTCTMANSANRLRERCAYPVIGWVMSKTRALGVTAVNSAGEPIKVVRFIHYHNDKQSAFDKGTAFKVGTRIMLHAPRGRDRLGRRPRNKKRYKLTGTRPGNRRSRLLHRAFAPRARSIIQWADALVEKHHHDRSPVVRSLVEQAHVNAVKEMDGALA